MANQVSAPIPNAPVGPGTAGTLPKFATTTTINDSILSQASTTITLTGGATATNTGFYTLSSINDFLQYDLKNTSTGTSAQSTYSLTADNGSPTTGFMSININNSTFTAVNSYSIGVANDTSVLGSGQDMYIANAHNTKDIILSLGKAASPFFDEFMRISKSLLQTVFTGTNGIKAIAAATQDAMVLKGRAGGTTSRTVTLTCAALTGNQTYTFPDLTGTVPILEANQNWTGFNTFTSANGIVARSSGTTQDSLVLAGSGFGSSSFSMAFKSVQLTASRVTTLQDATGTVPLLESTQTFTGVDTFRNASGIRTEAAATQDAVVIAGRAGGSTSLAITIQPDTLTANATQTLQNIAGVQPLSIFCGTADATVVNTAAATTIIPTGVGVTTLPANFLKVGKTIRVIITGVCASVVSPNLTVNFNLGGTQIATGTLSGTPNSSGFIIEATFTCRTAGAGGTVIAGGMLRMNQFITSITKSTTTAIDTTATKAIDVVVQWSTANVANTITTQICTIEALN